MLKGLLSKISEILSSKRNTEGYSFSLGEIISRGLNWIMMPILPLFVSSSVFGEISLYIVVIQLLSVLLLFGQNKSILRYYNEKGYSANIFFTVIVMWFALILLILPVTYIFYSSVSKYSQAIEGMSGITVLLILGIVIFNGFRQLYLSIQIAKKSGKNFLIDQILYSFSRFIIILAFVVIYRNSISYVYAMLTIGLIIIIYELVDIRNYTKLIVNWKLMPKLWLLGWPFIFHVLGGNILSYFDRFLIDYYMDISDVGIYTFAYSFGSAISFLFAPMVIIYEPKVYQSANSDYEAEYWLIRFKDKTLVLTSSFAAIMIIVIPIIVKSMYGLEYNRSIILLPMIFTSMIFNVFYIQGNFRLTLKEKTKYIPMITAFSGIINIIINIILIPRIGLTGAAIATFISYLIQAVLNRYISFYAGEEKDNTKGSKCDYLYIIFLISTILIGNRYVYAISMLIFSGVVHYHSKSKYRA